MTFALSKECFVGIKKLSQPIWCVDSKPIKKIELEVGGRGTMERRKVKYVKWACATIGVDRGAKTILSRENIKHGAGHRSLLQEGIKYIYIIKLARPYR